jgi:hypothetical protein
MFASVFALSLNACDRPECQNSNPAFKQYRPETRQYKLELAREIRRVGADDLRYWYNQTVVRGGKEYMLLNVQGDGVCASGEVRVTDWTGIQGLRAGTGYRGAELDGLRLAISESSEDVLEYKGLERILD